MRAQTHEELAEQALRYGAWLQDVLYWSKNILAIIGGAAVVLVVVALVMGWSWPDAKATADMHQAQIEGR